MFLWAFGSFVSLVAYFNISLIRLRRKMESARKVLNSKLKFFMCWKLLEKLKWPNMTTAPHKLCLFCSAAHHRIRCSMISIFQTFSLSQKNWKTFSWKACVSNVERFLTPDNRSLSAYSTLFYHPKHFEELKYGRENSNDGLPRLA